MNEVKWLKKQIRLDQALGKVVIGTSKWEDPYGSHLIITFRGGNYASVWAPADSEQIDQAGRLNELCSAVVFSIICESSPDDADQYLAKLREMGVIE